MELRVLKKITASLMMIIAGLGGTIAKAEGSIEWRVENSFRLFLNPEHSKAHIDLYRSLSDEEKKTPVLSMERKLADNNQRGWAEDVFTQTCWDNTRNRYRFCRGKGVDYINPNEHKVLVRYTGSFAPTDRCEWTFIADRKGSRRGTAYRQASLCGDEIGFAIPFPKGGRISVSINGIKKAKTLIRVSDIFIVGVGDSFASGEGNPDDPVKFTDEHSADYGLDPNKRPMKGYPTRRGDWKEVGDASFLREAARWQSRACHRSLYSYQLRTALQLAIEDPHRAVTFAGFACSGSEITVGMFLRFKGNEWDKHPPQLPQLSYVSEEICGKGSSTPKLYTSGYSQLGKLPELENMVLNKCYKPRRKIDLLLVSIGGNDVGFSSLVANAIMQDKSLLKKVGGWLGGVYGPGEARKALGVLKTRYTALNKAFHYMLKIPWKQSDRIILSAYPRMERTQDGNSLCPSGNAGMSLYPDFSVVNSKLKKASDFADELFDLMKASSRAHGWTFVDEHRDQFASHGFCAVSPEDPELIAEQLDLPRYANKEWSSYQPSEYLPYASRQRWFRTPNDAYMTGHFHTSGVVSNRLMRHKRTKWFQVVMAGTYSGSFHPTAEGHAVIADAVVKKAREVLRKYSK